MLTISTNTKTLYINIDLLKSKIKKIIILLFKILVVACGVVGFLLMVSGAGKHENNLITFSQALIQILKGLLIIIISYILHNFKKVLEG